MIRRVPVAIPEPILRALRPNDVLEAKFTEGFRCGYAKARGWQKPRGVHTVNASQGLVRSIVRVAFLCEARPKAAVDLHLEMLADFTCDDDAWLFLVKPTVDGMADAWGWSKDRLRVEEVSGRVRRDLGVGLVVEVYDVEET